MRQMEKFVLMDVDIEYLLDGEVLFLLEYVDAAMCVDIVRVGYGRQESLI
jgi:hypothetical protein